MEDDAEKRQDFLNAAATAALSFILGFVTIAVPWVFGLDRTTFVVSSFFGTMVVCVVAEALLEVPFSVVRLIFSGLSFSALAALLLLLI